MVYDGGTRERLRKEAKKKRATRRTRREGERERERGREGEREEEKGKESSTGEFGKETASPTGLSTAESRGASRYSRDTPSSSFGGPPSCSSPPRHLFLLAFEF